MNSVELENKLMSLSNKRQLLFVCRLAHAVTIFARDAYVPGSDDVSDPRMLRQMNEIEHRLIGQACNLISENPTQYLDSSFCELMSTLSAHPQHGGRFVNTIDRLLDGEI